MHSQNTANHTINQLISHGNSPTPLAFTPTSVLRKMTADKDTQSPSTYCQNPQYHVHQQNAKQVGTRENVLEPQLTATMAVQPRMILGGGNFAIGQNNQHLSPNMSQSRNQQVLKWTSGNMQMVHGKTFGKLHKKVLAIIKVHLLVKALFFFFCYKFFLLVLINLM